MLVSIHATTKRKFPSRELLPAAHPHQKSWKAPANQRISHSGNAVLRNPSAFPCPRYLKFCATRQSDPLVITRAWTLNFALTTIGVHEALRCTQAIAAGQAAGYSSGPKVIVLGAIARFSEPLALTSVFPYLPEMIESFGVEKNNVAKWAGITSAIFSLAQSAAAVPWGRASDKFGRKPIILIGLVNAMITFLIWGMATNLPMAILVRGLQGAGSGNVGIIRTMVAEMVPERELQPRAFSIMPLVWSIGSVFGPAFGGFFAKPFDQFPGLFGDSRYFHKFPFALPNLVLACFFFMSCATGFLFLRETLETKRHTRDWGRQLGKKIARCLGFRKAHHHHHHHNQHHVVDDGESGPLLYHVTSNTSSTYPDEAPVQRGLTPPRPTIKEVFTPQTMITLLCYTIMALHSVAYDQVLPVFLNYPPQVPNDENTKLPFYFSGGFGLSSNKIGTIFTVYGITCGLVQFLLFPPACNRWGVLNCYKACTSLFPVVYFLTPYTALIQDPKTRIAIFMCLMVLKAVCVIFGFPCITILFTNSAPDLRILGTLNGFATTMSGLGRAVGPAVAGAAFTWGVKNNYVVTSWWFLSFTAALGAIPVWWIVEGDGPRHPDDSSSSEDEGEEETLVGDLSTQPSGLSSSFEDELAVVDEENEEIRQLDGQTPLLSRSFSNEQQHPHHHAHYSTFGMSYERIGRLSDEGKDLQNAEGDTDWKPKCGDYDSEN
ncbi:uncharacterized protein MKZ38_001780 [Zalerion maritima]|uniref:Major facilitator superfamily (MFS) profile domain-containing protein n=1 Tax=Zalerion maritima TaxID=339359 RepID=A0AAD5WXZ3_9PEZI|nr:uncharacterized protein MKZ38_001780 [Zalerion maritima]